MNVKLLAHTQLSEDFYEGDLVGTDFHDYHIDNEATDGQAVALSAIRTCYSPNKPSEIVTLEGAKYFGKKASDGEQGTEADRLFRMIVRSGHTSTLEHLSFTFAIEGVSRALLAQLTRHRVGFSFSVQSQRYVRFGSGDRSGGFDYVVPESIKNGGTAPSNDDEGIYVTFTAQEYFEDAMTQLQYVYDRLRKAGIPAEDARAVLPQAAATNLVMTANLRSLLEFYAKRKSGKGAQAEIAQLAEELKNAVIAVEPWTRQFFESK
ncbi:FAD-dependent thymidylate synthase [Cytobacillus solani]|uniref:Flavin-dependent thymidylate synthase n=1 Tax=Cytobacillus solani TaxID=1637975 RepID=A0A0Q3TFH8_9BACI|nr:FAD-dependent thymidylate synthase [Cytobacillus solani]KQL21869.1 thymidylate synthase [Cytobacillus solani]